MNKMKKQILQIALSQDLRVGFSRFNKPQHRIKVSLTKAANSKGKFSLEPKRSIRSMLHMCTRFFRGLTLDRSQSNSTTEEVKIAFNFSIDHQRSRVVKRLLTQWDLQSYTHVVTIGKMRMWVTENNNFGIL